MRYLLFLLIFTNITLFSMEEEELSMCPFPFSISKTIKSEPKRPPTPKEEKHDEQVATLTKRALDLYFEDEEISVDDEYFTEELSTRVNRRLRAKRKSVMRIMKEYEAIEDLEANDHQGTEDKFRKEMRDLVTYSIKEALTEKEETIRVQEKSIQIQKNKLKIAAIGAFTTIFTTSAATTVALIMYFSE